MKVTLTIRQDHKNRAAPPSACNLTCVHSPQTDMTLHKVSVITLVTLRSHSVKTQTLSGEAVLFSSV